MRGAIVILALLSACAPPKYGSRQYTIDEAEKAITERLKDPSSAQFSDVRISDTGAVCGKINGKNSFGAYSGAGEFVYIPMQAIKEDQPIVEFGAHMEGDHAVSSSDKGSQTVNFSILYMYHCLGLSREQMKRDKADLIKSYRDQ